MYREIPQRVKDTVANLFLEGMNQQFPEGFVFGPVLVEESEFMDGEPNLRVTIVYEGDFSQMDHPKRYRQLDRISDKVFEAGIEEPTIPYFWPKSLWESQNLGQKKDAGG